MNGGLLQQLQSGDVPVAPTAAVGTNTTQIATTEFAMRAGLNYSSPCGLYLSTSSYLAQPMIPTSTTQLNAIVDSGDYALIPNSGATDFLQVSPGVLSLSLSGLVSGKGYDVFLWNAASPALLLSAAWANAGQFVTGATNATPIVITSNAHGLSNGDVVEIDGVLGNTAANGVWNVANKTTNTYELSGSAGNGAYVSGGWMSSRGTAYLDRLKGILVNGATIGSMGSKRGLYLGSIYASATNTTEQTGKTWYVDNMYNRKKIGLSCSDPNSSWSYSTSTFRQANGSSTNQVKFFLGRPRFVTANLTASTAGTVTGYLGIGIDSTTTPSGSRHSFTIADSGFTIYGTALAAYAGILGSGFHYLAWLEFGPGVATTWYGKNGDNWDHGMTASYLG